MVDAELFDKLENLARIIRDTSEPFGGIQVIVCGDFFQLPPVKPGSVTKFAFEAVSWSKVINQTYLLEKVFRQKDAFFSGLLNEMRLGQLSPRYIDILKSLSRKPVENNGIQPTELYPLRSEVDASNKRRLDDLPGELVDYQAIDTGDKKKVEQCIAPAMIQLKLQAQVMLLKNVDMDLANGSVGIVVGFLGQGSYTGNLEKLRTPQRQNGVYNDPSGSSAMNYSYPYPIVRFANRRELIIEHETWSISLPGGKIQASRTQIPLMLAWAISIHKSQGQTMDYVKVDLAKVFEKGQSYVALSRATCMERLQVLNFNSAKVMAHPRVTEFYKTFL